MILSERLEAIISLVTEGNRVADVGCDHGFVPICLVQREISPNVIAMDINSGPASRALEHIREQGLDDKIEVRVSNGMEKLEPFEVDTLICAGMGGPLMLKILKAYPQKTKSLKEFILQPQSEIEQVRRWIRENGYRILKERMIFEDGKYYPMMKIVDGDLCENRPKQNCRGYLLSDFYGPRLIEENDPVLRTFLAREKNKNLEILTNLEKISSPDERIKRRIKEIKSELNQLETVQRQMDGQTDEM